MQQTHHLNAGPLEDLTTHCLVNIQKKTQFTEKIGMPITLHRKKPWWAPLYIYYCMM